MVRAKRVTISDVAKIAGVSKQTVSRVINDRPDVAEQTRVLVRNAIARLGYQPDPIARSMKGVTQTIGCIVSDLTSHPNAQLLQAAQIELRKNHFSFLIECAPGFGDVRTMVNHLLSRRIDGLLIINPNDSLDFSFAQAVINQDIPIVYFGNLPPSPLLSSVIIDHQYGAFLATSHLLSLGHTSIFMATEKGHQADTCQKQDGFTQAFMGTQQDLRPDHLFLGGGPSIIKYINRQREINNGPGFTAIFAHSDAMAIEIISALRSVGLQVPKDVSIIGYGDIPFTSQFSPALTSIQTPDEEGGRSCAQLLIELISNPHMDPKKIRIKPRLHLRESCLPYTNNVLKSKV